MCRHKQPGEALTLSHVIGGELSSCSQLDTNRSAQLLDAARSLGEDEAAAATAVAATAAGALTGRRHLTVASPLPTIRGFATCDSAAAFVVCAAAYDASDLHPLLHRGSHLVVLAGGAVIAELEVPEDSDDGGDVAAAAADDKDEAASPGAKAAAAAKGAQQMLSFLVWARRLLIHDMVVSSSMPLGPK